MGHGDLALVVQDNSRHKSDVCVGSKISNSSSRLAVFAYLVTSIT